MTASKEARAVLRDLMVELGGPTVFRKVRGWAEGQPREAEIITLCDEVEAKLKDETDRQPLRREGREHSRWVLLDYGDLVVHVFDQETRDYYQLERLWADAPRIAYEPASAEA